MITKILAVFIMILLSCICHADDSPSPYSADVIVLPNDGRKPILDLIQNAVESVWVCSYELLDEKIIDSLRIAKQCGVDVRVMLEGKPYGSSTVNTGSAKKLIGTGISFSWSNPQFTLTHANYIIVDHRKILLMTIDLTESSIIRNRGYGVFIDDPRVISEAEAIFLADWQKKEYTPVCPGMLFCDNSRQGLIELISNAKKKIWIQTYLMQDEEIMESIVEAKKRGVSLKIICSEATPLVNDINLKAQKYLSSHEISIKLQQTLSPYSTLMFLDEKIVFIGSQGLDTKSLNNNREMGIIITCPQAIKRLKGMFLHDLGRSKICEISECKTE